MADNYLERKMEEHRRNGGASPFRRKTTPTGQRLGKALIDFPPINVFVVDGAAGLGALIVQTLRNAGCRVAFSSSDDKAGAAAAQRYGAQFHPSALGLAKSLNILADKWGGVDLLIASRPVSGVHCRQLCLIPHSSASEAVDSFAEVSQAPDASANAIVLPEGEVDEKAIAAMVMLLASPAAASIRGQVFRL